MQMVLEIPEELKGVGEAVQALVRQVEASWRSTRGGRAVDYAAIERQVAAGTAAIERASHQAVLQGLDIDQPRVGILALPTSLPLTPSMETQRAFLRAVHGKNEVACLLIANFSRVFRAFQKCLLLSDINVGKGKGGD
jgi:hypothetical protein